jgi:hypothetical protein
LKPTKNKKDNCIKVVLKLGGWPVDITQDLDIDKMEMIKRSLAEAFLFVENLEQQAKGELDFAHQELEAEETAEFSAIHQSESLGDGGFGTWDE